ncbi:hypothetical protein [Streptomyces sp. SID5910]|uniref:hypothetical protein n=1 Tax=Streptomyces sp. SID5910 TaxID=2690312 RepID=UPI00137068AE|nr:hypothetical protein [Streptomyces sp. SID5910]MYR45438.1 hypothetical protein [Streptomyces sp. SID5910]
MTTHAVRLECAGATVTVDSAEQAVCRWVERYFGAWWRAAEVDPAGVCARPLVSAVVDTEQYDAAALAVTQVPHASTVYARARMLLARDASAGVIRAVSPEEGLAYRSEPGAGKLDVVGRDAGSVATATARLAREVMRGALLRDGWAVLHASAVVQDGRTLLAFGGKGAGKTTTALALASRHRFGLLANDRVFVRPDSAGGVTVLPWPSAAAVGLGLLEALGWSGIARERLRSGDALHPTQDRRVTDALLAGDRTPLWERGRELKAQVWPDQFTSWFGVPLATEGEAAALLFPRVEAGADPAVEDSDRRLGDADFMSGATEDRYPDVLGLVGVDGGGGEATRREVARRLAGLPRHSVVLGHDAAANADFLAEVTARV